MKECFWRDARWLQFYFETLNHFLFEHCRVWDCWYVGFFMDSTIWLKSINVLAQAKLQRRHRPSWEAFQHVWCSLFGAHCQLVQRLGGGGGGGTGWCSLIFISDLWLWPNKWHHKWRNISQEINRVVVCKPELLFCLKTAQYEMVGRCRGKAL